MGLQTGQDDESGGGGGGINLSCVKRILLVKAALPGGILIKLN